ncbi:hypothetical protein CFO_g2552 [Ceratocystis platani]|uniref:IEC3 subunit of the Ino80 complex, chromatin re-modelling-domain-containing protein n=1 Tax=Ceratocystis fimbriata f. sp. platani TaxID=88771 RepID=A0A0F8CWN8_CERFI|nr:hypothetical protein CFO_g2552 [Ceratocystis platani]
MASNETRRKAVDAQHKDDAQKTDSESKQTYRSWKKKYRKMMARFDNASRDNREIYKNEMFAQSIINRISVENDRLLEILLSINETPQIPANKRFDLSLDLPDDVNTPVPDIDLTPEDEKLMYGKALKQLDRSIIRANYEATKRDSPETVQDLVPAEGKTHPPTFLTMDDINAYIYDIDQRLGIESKPPIVATDAEMYRVPSSRDSILNNPVSEYNWLRKHAPKTFLQDGVQNPPVAGHGKEAKDKDLPSRAAPGTAGTGGGSASGSGGANGTSASASRGRGSKRGARGVESDHSDDEDAGSRPVKKRRVVAAAASAAADKETGTPVRSKPTASGIKHVKKKAKRQSSAPDAAGVEGED